MDDLSEIKSSLPTSFLSLFIEELELSESDQESLARLEAFWESISTPDEKETILNGAILELLPVLSPLLQRPDGNVKQVTSKIIIEGLGMYGSPKEGLIGLAERLEDLIEISDAIADDGGVGWGENEENTDMDDGQEDDQDEVTMEDAAPTYDDDLDDDESDGPEIYEYSDSSAGDDSDDEDPDLASLPQPILNELPTLLFLLSNLLARLPLTKSLPTIMNIQSLLPPALERISIPQTATSEFVGKIRAVVKGVEQVVKSALLWSQQCTDWSERGEQKSILLNLLAQTVSHLYEGLAVDSGEQAFLLRRDGGIAAISKGKGKVSEHDHSQSHDPQPNEWSVGMDAILSTTLSLLSTPTSVAQTIDLLPYLSPKQNFSTHASLTLILLSYHLSTISDPSEFFKATPQSAGMYLSRSISSGLIGDIPRSASISWIASCLLSLQPPSSLEDPYTLTPTETRDLFTAYLPDLALAPSSLKRQTIFAMLAALLTNSPPTLISPLIIPLLSPNNPLPPLRAAGWYFLKPHLSSSSLEWLKPDLELLRQSGFRCPFEGDEGRDFNWDEEEDEDGEEWIRGPGPAFVVHALGAFRVLWCSDVNNTSGVREPSFLVKVKSEWLEPLRKKLDARAPLDNDETKGAFDIVRSAVENLEVELKNSL